MLFCYDKIIASCGKCRSRENIVKFGLAADLLAGSHVKVRNIRYGKIS